FVAAFDGIGAESRGNGNDVRVRMGHGPRLAADGGRHGSRGVDVGDEYTHGGLQCMLSGADLFLNRSGSFVAQAWAREEPGRFGGRGPCRGGHGSPAEALFGSCTRI